VNILDGKKLYNKPKLIKHGNVEELTKGTVKGGIETGGYRKSNVH